MHVLFLSRISSITNADFIDTLTGCRGLLDDKRGYLEPSSPQAHHHHHHHPPHHHHHHLLLSPPLGAGLSRASRDYQSVACPRHTLRITASEPWRLPAAGQVINNVLFTCGHASLNTEFGKWVEDLPRLIPPEFECSATRQAHVDGLLLPPTLTVNRICSAGDW